MSKTKLKLTDNRDSFKPFVYPEFYELWKQHESIHWLHTVVSMQQDIKDWKKNLTEPQKNFLTQILRLFTQSDIDVAGAYIDNYLPVFKHPEIRMMLLGFAAREAIHIAAYSHLLESLGFPDSIYNDFLKHKEMVDKHNFFAQISSGDKKNVVQQMCAVSAFTEGMQLFSSFVMLLNFGRNNLMPGMSKIITWSVIDESCLIGDTEILTPLGWKKIEDVSLRDKILQYDIDNKQTTFVYPRKLVHNKTKQLNKFDGPQYSQITSPEHRMIIEENGKIIAKRSSEIRLEQNFSYILSGNKAGSLKKMTEKHIELCELSAKGELSLQWIMPLLEIIDFEWAKEFLIRFKNIKQLI